MPFNQRKRNIVYKKEKHPVIVNVKMFCLINNDRLCGTFLIDEGIVTYNLNSVMRNDVTLFMGSFMDPKFPMVYNNGDPVSMLLGKLESYRTNVNDFSDNDIGSMTIITRNNDDRRRVNIFVQKSPPYDLDGMMWGIDKVCIDCKQCSVKGCECRGRLPRGDYEC